MSISKILALLVGVASFCGASISSAATGDRFISRTRQLTFEGRRAGEGYFSPDGKKLILQAERYRDNPFFQIYTLDLKTGYSRLISPGMGRTTCSFFRAGTNEVLFASTHLDPKAREKQVQEYAERASRSSGHTPFVYDEQYDIFSSDQRGRHLKQLTTTLGYDAEGAYSPDGKLIVFCSFRDAYPHENLSSRERELWERQPQYFGDLYLMNADGSNQRRLTHTPGYDGGPFFTPDGQRVIYRHFNENGLIADVFTIKIDGTGKRRLTDFHSMSWAPYMHPSGEYAIFTSNKFGFGNFELFIVDAMGAKEPIRVTYTDGFDGLPVFSPDGDELCWTSNRATRVSRTGLLFMADWNHAAALKAIQAAPLRGTVEEPLAKFESPMTQWPSGRPKHIEKGLQPGITQDDLYEHVAFLASDKLEGRMTGSPGVKEAGEYIARCFKQAGLEPLGEEGSYFQPFTFAAGAVVVPGRNELTIEAHGELSERRLELDKEFRPLSFTLNGETEGEVVCAGYGLVVPKEQDEPGYDSYEGLDVHGKIVLVFDDVPVRLEPDQRIRLNHYAQPRYKAKQAMNRGAKGFLLVVGPNTAGAGTLPAVDRTPSSSGIVAAAIGLNAAQRLLEGTGLTLAAIQGLLDEGVIPDHFAKLQLTSRVKLRTFLERREGRCRNVVGLLPPVGEGRIADEYVLVGAHYDHIGRGEGGGSLARAGEVGQIHNGADDNASGVSVVLELAAALSKAWEEARSDGQQRGVIFACWSGEEMGVLGSTHFTRHPPCPLGQIAAYVNFDMVGRLRDGKLILQATGSSDDWLRLVEMVNIREPLNVMCQADPYLPTDTHEFYPAGIPVLSFFTDVHADYNRPTDDTGTLNYAGLEQITKFGREFISELAMRPDKPAYKASTRAEPPRQRRHASRRAYTGTIPDFTASDVQGMKISGVQGGSPAEQAGLQPGDVIIMFAGHAVSSLQDYSDALGVIRPGEPVEIVVRRGKDEHHLSITPSARK